MSTNEELDVSRQHRYLSAPWRMRYLSKSKSTPGCVFCEKLASTDDVDNLVLWRGKSIAILMNLFPYSTGHIMLLPYQHVASPELLEDPSIMTEIGVEIPLAMRALRRVLSCEGFNTGMNTGGAAGAGIADHMHMHVVPRWGGDANFMPIIAHVTVMPEELSITYAKLRAELMVEHDESRPVNAMVFSADWTYVLLLNDREVPAIPSALTNREISIAKIMARQLEGMGVEATIAGWAGHDTVVWQASADVDPNEGVWGPITELPNDLAPIAREALARRQ